MIRGVILGLLGVSIVCGFTYFNDAVIKQWGFIVTLAPTTVFGGLVLLLVAVNPLLLRLGRRLALSGRELAIALSMTLVVCSIPSNGLMRTLTPTLILPIHFEHSEPGWKEQEIVRTVPRQMLVDIRADESRILNGFVQGMSIGQKHISFSNIPWRAWSKTLLFWIPLALAIFVALIGLAVAIHKQWAEHEHLPYPIAGFANTLLPRAGEAFGGVFRDRFFVIGFFGVLIIHLNNYLVAWFPNWVAVPLSYSFVALGNLFPTFQLGDGGSLLTLQIFFAAVGFAYLIASDVSFSVGIGPFIFSYIMGLFASYGIDLAAGSRFTGGVQPFLAFGAFLGVFLALAYTGRYYYLRVLRQSLFLSAPEDSEAAWGGRFFIIGSLIAVLLLSLTGLDWQLALLFVFLVVLIFAVLARTVAETGLYVIQAAFNPVAIIAGLFGARALGVESFLILALASIVFTAGTVNGMMLYLVNALKLGQLQNVSIGRTGHFSFLALVVGIGIALPVGLYFQYDRGYDRTDNYVNNNMVRPPFREGISMKQRLISQGNLDFSTQISGWRRFVEISPSSRSTYAMIIGLGLVLLTTFGRLRSPRFPIHPIMFLVWGTYMNRSVAGAFLLGWLIKTIITKYGGHTLYQRVKPMMFGLIAGDLMGGCVPIVVGFIYYLMTGDLPKVYQITPG